jgi:hypothetical protein
MAARGARGKSDRARPGLRQVKAARAGIHKMRL